MKTILTAVNVDEEIKENDCGENNFVLATTSVVK